MENIHVCFQQQNIIFAFLDATSQSSEILKSFAQKDATVSHLYTVTVDKMTATLTGKGMKLNLITIYFERL